MTTTNQIIDFLRVNDMLALGGSPWPRWDEANEDRHVVDWSTLFPSVGPNRDQRVGPNDWDIFDPEWDPELVDDVRNDLDCALTSDTLGGGWDVCAWYQPLHYFGARRGVFIRSDCIRSQARSIRRFLSPPTSRVFDPALDRALIHASACAYFRHEQYHHKVESLGIRLQVVDRKPIYVPYDDKVYKPCLGKDDQLEEALASAGVYRRLMTSTYLQWIGRSVVDATRDYLKARFPLDPPGYRRAGTYLSKNSFDSAQNLLMARVHEQTLIPLQPSGEWGIAARMTQSLFKVTDRIYEIVPKGIRGVLPTR